MRRSYAQLAQILFLTVSLFSTSLAQSPGPQKRKKIKDFGSSLKRLKWDPQKNAAIQLPAAGDEVDEGDVIRIDTSLVSCELLVMDQRGNSVTGLTAKDFTVTEDGTPQTVGHFLTGDNVKVPRTIVLIIDYSGSQMPFLKNSVNAAKVLVDKLGPTDLMAIVTDDVELIHEFTSDKKKLKSKLDQLVERSRVDSVFFSGKPRIGLSRQYSALMATLNELFSEEDMRPIIIFQTDGDEAYFLRNPVIEMTVPEGLEGSALRSAQSAVEFHRQHALKNNTEFSLDDLYRTVERSRATVYTVIPGIKLMGLTPEEQFEKMRAQRNARLMDVMKLLPSDRRASLKERMAKSDNKNDEINIRWEAERTEKLQSALSVVGGLTGGWTEFLETPEEADAIYSRIFSDINQRYIVGYYPTNKERDGKRRKIDFQVKGHSEYQVLGRRTYFAPGP